MFLQQHSVVPTEQLCPKCSKSMKSLKHLIAPSPPFSRIQIEIEPTIVDCVCVFPTQKCSSISSWTHETNYISPPYDMLQNAHFIIDLHPWPVLLKYRCHCIFWGMDRWSKWHISLDKCMLFRELCRFWINQDNFRINLDKFVWFY